MVFDSFQLRHLPGLLTASSETFGGFWPIFNAERVILAFGLPEPIAQSVPAQATMFIASSRISTIGMIIFALYGQGNLAAVDTVLAVMGLYVGVMDGYLCWREGRWACSALPVRSWLRLLGWLDAQRVVGAKRRGPLCQKLGSLMLRYVIHGLLDVCCIFFGSTAYSLTLGAP
jgi:hypothetical protein